MSDDHETQLEAIEALLRAEPDSDAGSTEVQHDAEFDAVMAFLDDIDPEQAAELDALAARAWQDLDLAAQHEDAPDEPPTPSALSASHLHLKEVISGDGRNRRAGTASCKGRRVTSALRLLTGAASIVGLVGVALAVAWGLLLIGGAATEAIADASPDGLHTTDLLATLMVAIQSMILLQRGLRRRNRSGRADGEQPSLRRRRRKRR